MNDVSVRDVQRYHGGQWHKGKSFDGTCPMGPWIVTADGIDPTNLRVTCRVNGVTKQDSNTKFLYFKLPRLIAELSAGMTLEAGRHHLDRHARKAWASPAPRRSS